MRKSSKSALGRTGRLQDGHLTIGLDLGDRSSFYCVLNGAGDVVLESRVATNPGQSTFPALKLKTRIGDLFRVS